MDKVVEKAVTKLLKVNDKSAYGFPEFKQIQNIHVYTSPIKENDGEVVRSETENLFDQIFSVDPITLLPNGDIAIWMSQNTSPEIRNFISQNLMAPVPLDTDGAKYDGLTDDDVAIFTRNQGESIADYRSRLFNHLKSNVEAERKRQQKSE